MTARPGGNIKEIDPREELFKARAMAREVLEKYGDQGTIFRTDVVLKNRMSDEARTRLEDQFPLIVSKDGRKHRWDLSVLGSILAWDDPVMMLKPLATSDPAWWGVFEKVQAKACTSDEEEVIRTAFDRLRMSVTVVGDPLITQDFPRFSENSQKRQK